jgi:hypothetical protein
LANKILKAAENVIRDTEPKDKQQRKLEREKERGRERGRRREKEEKRREREKKEKERKRKEQKGRRGGEKVCSSLAGTQASSAIPIPVPTTRAPPSPANLKAIWDTWGVGIRSQEHLEV